MSNRKYTFKAREGSVLSDAQAQRYGIRIEQLMRTTGGKVTNEMVLEDAKNPRTPYHDYFEWDNKKAGEKWRLEQARTIIGSIIKVQVIKREKVESRAFMSVVDQNEGRVYVPISTVVETPDYKQQVITDTKRTISALLNLLNLIEKEL